MKINKALFLTAFVVLTLMLGSCTTSRKSHKNYKRYHNKRCDCSRFSVLSSNEVSTLDWVAQHDGQADTK